MYYILASTKKPVIRRNLQTRVKYLHKHGLFPRRKVFSFPALTFPVSSSIIMRHSKCGRSSVAEHQLPKLNMRVRFPSPAPNPQVFLGIFFALAKACILPGLFPWISIALLVVFGPFRLRFFGRFICCYVNLAAKLRFLSLALHYLS